ncbi:MAG: DUF4430 domain-containing protein [Clostridia bacterium]
MNRIIKNTVIVFVVLIILALLLSNIQTIEDFYMSDRKTGNVPVTISINCQTVLSNYSLLDKGLQNSKYIPQNGVILPKTTVYINKGDTVLDALKKVTKENKIQLEYTQSPNDSYVEGINYIYEFSCGELSGWMFKVNGTFAQKGCNSYILNENDYIEWVYTCDLGKDVGEEFE